jgi:hypothetical protein
MTTVNIRQIDHGGYVPVSGSVAVDGSTVGVSGTVTVSGTALTTIATNSVAPVTWTVLPNLVSVSAAAATPLTATSTSAAVRNGLTLQAGPGNTAVVYVGTSAVTSAAAWMVAMSGGDAPIQIGVREAALVYCYATVSGQSVAWSGV